MVVLSSINLCRVRPMVYGCGFFVFFIVWAWVTEYMQVSMLVNTMLCFNNRYLHMFSHPSPYPILYIKL